MVCAVSFIVCAIVGSAVGSAFTVMSTIGIAFFGIGSTLGLNPALVVGRLFLVQFLVIKCHLYQNQQT